MTNQPDTILCPWCGAEMEIEVVWRRIDAKGKRVWNAWPSCTNDDCAAEGPFVMEKETEQEAYAEAIAAVSRRYTPPIKPLTLAEARRRNNSGEPLYVESNPSDPKGNLPPVNDWIVYFKWLQMSIAPDAEPYDYIEEGYGVSYRCWERKPTEEERKAATWEY